MPPVPISSINQIRSDSPIEITHSTAPLKNIALGEILPATVLEKISDNKYLLSLKNINLPATSTVPLSVGEKLVVKVNSLQPQVILNVIENKNQNSDNKINEKLLQWRANPESLLQVISKVTDFAKMVQTGDLPRTFSPNDAAKIIKLFENIIFSHQTSKNPLFLKEFVSRTGLLLENTLKQIVADSAKGLIEKPLDDNLKTLLLKLSAAVDETLRENSRPDSQFTAKLSGISAFTDEALKAIEAKQVLNTVFQDSDQGLVLQVPVAMAEGFRMADIFITPDEQNEQGKKKFSSCSVAIFLDFDMLGKMIVNAGVREGGFSCLIKCEKDEIKELISNKIDGLRTLLAATGYRVDYLDCIKEEGLIQQREAFLEKQSFSAVDLVNFFV